VAVGADTISYFRRTAESLINLAHLFVIPARQTIEKADPTLISHAVHPLSILLNLPALVLEVLQRFVNILSPLAKPIGTGNDFYAMHESCSFPADCSATDLKRGAINSFLISPTHPAGHFDSIRTVSQVPQNLRSLQPILQQSYRMKTLFQ
jgi:hypothetical protein